MKTSKKAFRLIILISIAGIFLSSCKSKNYENTTEIFDDGSCNRTISIKGDSSVLEKQVFPYLIDSAWHRKTEIVDAEKNIFKVTASRHFDKVEELNLQKPNDSLNWSQLNHSFDFKKKFRWFYSYLTYSETYKKTNPFELIPVTDYISRDELAIIKDEYTEYLAGRDSAEIAKIKDEIMGKALTWVQASAFEEFIQTLAKNAGTVNNPKITAELIKSNSDTIKGYLKLKNEDITSTLFNIDSLMTICNTYFKTTDFDKLKPANSRVFDEYTKKGEKLDLIFNMMSDNEINSVVMPGILINTNCKTVIGNKIRWEFNVAKSFFSNYEVSVTSRITNIWAFVVSGIFLIILLIAIVAGLFVKRKK